MPTSVCVGSFSLFTIFLISLCFSHSLSLTHSRSFSLTHTHTFSLSCIPSPHITLVSYPLSLLLPPLSLMVVLRWSLNHGKPSRGRTEQRGGRLPALFKPCSPIWSEGQLKGGSIQNTTLTLMSMFSMEGVSRPVKRQPLRPCYNVHLQSPSVAQTHTAPREDNSSTPVVYNPLCHWCVCV